MALKDVLFGKHQQVQHSIERKLEQQVPSQRENARRWFEYDNFREKTLLSQCHYKI